MGKTWRCDRGSARGGVVLLLILAASSCRLIEGAVEAPGKVLHPKKDDPPPAGAVQGDVMRFADRFNAQILDATRTFSDRVGTPAARIQALDWSIRARTEAITIASGPNPHVALLDMLVSVTLGRLDHEEHWMPHVWGDADQPVVDAYKSLEAEIWDVARKTFDAKQLGEVRAMIDSCHKDDADQASAAPASLADVEHLLAAHREEKQNTFEEIGKLFSLDPLAGLEPAKREIAEARLLGERTLFYAQRAPLIFSSQAELLGLNLANLPEIHEALQKSERVSEAAASLADTAAKLPAAVRSEREALVQDLASSEAPVGRMLGDARATLDAARDSSAAVQSAVQSLDAFVARTREGSGSSADPEMPGRPFDVREYGEAAAKIGEAAKGLDDLVQSVDRSESRVEHLIDEAGARGDESIRRASISFLAVGLTLICAGAAATIAVRRLSGRTRQTQEKPS